ncbi:MAG: hypothetical protein K9M57_08360, partial [Phycisphaerae bacterium]|nr:hypothetical protein [Phycisphaerae bacterium]
TAGQGAIFPGKLYAGREVVAVRIYWDIVVAEGYDAAEIIANMHLPILSDPEHLVKIPLDGTVLGWSGSGTFSYHEVTDKYNFKFGPEWTGYDWWFTGPWDPSDPLVEMWPLDAVEVLPSSHIEIDYLIPCRYTLPGDVDKDCKVDLVDFALLAASWLADCVINPGDPACIPRE